MIPKIVRVGLIALTSLALAAILPNLYRQAFETPSTHLDLAYSEVAKDFLITHTSYGSRHSDEQTTIQDRAGKLYTEQEVQALQILGGGRRGLSEEEMAELLKEKLGLNVTPEAIQAAELFDYCDMNKPSREGLFMLFETKSGRVTPPTPTDYARFRPEGIEIYDPKTNAINRELTPDYRASMAQAGLQLPVAGYHVLVSGLSADVNVFVLDAQKQAFRIRREQGRLACYPLPLPSGLKIAAMTFCFSPDPQWWGFVQGEDRRLWVLSREGGFTFLDTGLTLAPGESLSTWRRDVLYNRVATSFSDESGSSRRAGASALYILDPTLKLIDKHQVVRPDDYATTTAGMWEARFFPFQMTWGEFHGWSASWAWIWVNLLLAGVAAVLIRRQHRSLAKPFNLLDLALVVAGGAYAFVAILVFPNRR